MTYETILADARDGGVGLITINRPQALNALNSHGSLPRSTRRSTDSRRMPRSAASLITGSEKAFAAGADIKEMQDLTFPQTYLDDFITAWDRGRRPAQADHPRRCRASRWAGGWLRNSP